MPLAVSDQGEAVYLTNGGNWEPARVAQNPQTGERLAFDGQEWSPLPKGGSAKRKVSVSDIVASTTPFFGPLMSGLGALSDAIGPQETHKAEARKRIEELKAAGAPVGGATDLLAQGLTGNASDEILAAALTPAEMIRKGTFNPIEGYRSAKAMEDATLEEARKNSGALGLGAEVLGGVTSGAGLAGKGVTAARFLQPNAGLASRTGASIADATGMGAVSGFNEGNTIGERLDNMKSGGLFGALFGAAAPTIGLAGKAALSPIISNIKARTNPQGYAEAQVARGLQEASLTPKQIADEVAMAAREGQPMFTVADAMGNPGQRMLATAAGAPGPGRTATVEFLDNRQAGQGRRVANALAEGFEMPATAEQTRTMMTKARDDAADIAFGNARKNAGAVDLSSVIAKIDDTITPGVNQIVKTGSNIADDGIESALSKFRNRMTDGQSVLSDFTAIQRLRFDMADAAKSARQAGFGNKARMIGDVVKELDNAMEAASGGYKAANKAFAQSSKNIGMIDEGISASTRGRTEDILPRYQGATPGGQIGFRAGYVDPLIARAQGADFGTNKARSLTGDAFRDEAAAMAPRNAEMQRRIGRENTMFQTRNQATGNSNTSRNMNDDAAMAMDPTIMASILSGNVKGAARAMLEGGYNLLSGNTPAVRAAVADMLMQRGQNVTKANLQRVLDETMKRMDRARRTAMILARGGMGGFAAGMNELSQSP